MKGTRIALAVALASLALLLFVYSGIDLITTPVWLVFRRAAGLETVRTLVRAAAFLTLLSLFAAGLVVAIPIALKPGNWLRKTLYVLPLCAILFALAAVIANLAGLATLGSILSMSGPIKISLALAWLYAGGALSAIAVATAVMRTHVSPRVLRTAAAATGVSLAPGLVLCLAMLAGGYIVTTASSGAPSAGAPAGPGSAGGLAGLIAEVKIGGGVMALLLVVASASWAVARRAMPASSAAGAPAPATLFNRRRELVRALASVAAVFLLGFLAIQLVPVPRTNPPVQSTVAWESTQTRDLVYRACMNCHSDETQWPWYSLLAPGSWITAVHVTSARQQFNLSELGNMSSPRKTRLARDMADQIRNGVMPPADYLMLHPEARLSSAEKEQLILGLLSSLK